METAIKDVSFAFKKVPASIGLIKSSISNQKGLVLNVSIQFFRQLL